jgi:hypothetical protein
VSVPERGSERAPAGGGVPQLETSLELRRIRPAELWELMWRESVQGHWVASTAPVRLVAGQRFVLGDVTGAWRTGSVQRVRRQRLEAHLLPASRWPDGKTRLAVSVAAAAGSDGSVVRIVESGFVVATQRAEASLFWTQALERLRELVRLANQRRESVRQAVVVIHGIGEQQPGHTLQQFVAGVLPEPDSGGEPSEAEKGELVGPRWVKPDRVSGSFELRKIVLRASPGRKLPQTELYEFYWAHVIRDTTLQQVLAWIRALLLRRGVPRAIRPAWFAIWAIVLVVLGGLLARIAGLWQPPPALAAGGIVVVLLTLAWRLVGSRLAVGFVGDAARYLRPEPANIAHRQEIREAGVELVERLHGSGRYDRIVLVGHSLGSAIAYDVLTHSWIRMHKRHSSPSSPSFTSLRAMERGINEAQGAHSEDPQLLQHAAWTEQRRNTQPWLVTDLVTLGSPLTYADFLLARSRDEFDAAVRDRVLPSCPPRTEVESRSGHRRCSFDDPYRVSAGGGTGTFTLLDHGALFGVTRWTNLYFRTRLLGLVGDPVGGPLGPLFGRWVRDVSMKSPRWGFAHTLYWRAAGRAGSHGSRRAPHLEQLWDALRLESGDDLRSVSAEMPAFALLEHEFAES